MTEARLEMNRVEAAALSASDIGTSDSKRDVKRPTLQTRAPQMSCYSQMALGLRARGLVSTFTSCMLDDTLFVNGPITLINFSRAMPSD